MASRIVALLALYKQSLAMRLSPQQASAACLQHSRGFGTDTNKPPGESRQGKYNTQEEAMKEDFIATPLPEVPREVRAKPEAFPHQSDEERKGDMDVPDEGESIAKTPSFAANDPNAAPEMGGTKRFHSTYAGLWPARRGLRTSAALLWATDAEKHPDAQRARDLGGPQTDSDPTAGTLGGDTSYTNIEVDDQDAKDPSRLNDPNLLHEKRRAKDPAYYDKVHPGNPMQAAEQAAHEGEQHARAARRRENDSVSGGSKASSGA